MARGRNKRKTAAKAQKKQKPPAKSSASNGVTLGRQKGSGRRTKAEAARFFP